MTVRGVCWSTSANPTTTDNKTVDGSGTGVFTSSITGLFPGTIYHVRAYATNRVGTSYGQDLSYKTKAPRLGWLSLLLSEEDTDKDGIPDEIEKASPCLKFSDPDTDGDGIKDGIEDTNKNGKVDFGETKPCKADTGGDGLDDGVEDTNKNGKIDTGETDPLNTDSDGDGILDGVEDANKNGLVDSGETDPLKADTDGDGLDDGVEDANKNGIKDSDETDPSSKDTDRDGMPDGWEVTYRLNPLVNDAHLDKDKDGASNIREYRKGTLPNDPKSRPPVGLPWVPLLLE